MSSSNRTDRRDSLLGIIDEAEREASRVKHAATRLAAEAARTQELARTFRPVVQGLASDSSLPTTAWDDLSTTWRGHSVQLGSISRVVQPAEAVFATGAAASLTTTVTSHMLSSWVSKSDPAISELRSLLSRSTKVDEMEDELHRLGLDQDDGFGRAPSELVSEAATALRGPTPTNAGVLIPLREAIHASIASLLRRVPRQAKASSLEAKITQIGAQCGRLGLGTEHFAGLSRTLRTVIAELAEAKAKQLSQSELSERFDSGIAFLRALLTSLDEAKLRE